MTNSNITSNEQAPIATLENLTKGLIIAILSFGVGFGGSLLTKYLKGKFMGNS